MAAGSALLCAALLASPAYAAPVNHRVAVIASHRHAGKRSARHKAKHATRWEVTVRVLGSAPGYRLLRLSRVSLTATPVSRYGGSCTGDSAAGALQLATGGQWSGAWNTKFGDYEVTGIEGIHLAFEPGAAANWYWSVWLGGKEASAGVCEVIPKPGDTLLFVPACYGKSCPSAPKIGKGALTDSLTDVRGGHRYSAKAAPRVIAGEVSSGFPISSVSIAISRVSNHRCYALRSSGALATGPCNRLSFVKARLHRDAGGDAFSLKLTHRLPAGRYVLRLRAGDVAGDSLSASASKVSFSVS